MTDTTSPSTSSDDRAVDARSADPRTSDPSAEDRGAAPAAQDEGASWTTAPLSAPVELRPVTRQGGPSRAIVWVALFVVASLSGAALFAAGFTLGVQQAITPGTAAEDQQLFEPFWEAWNKVTTEYVGDYDPQQLVEGSIKGIFESLGDPYSGYMTSEEYRASLSGISGEFEGIGAEMSAQDAQGASCTPISETCRLTVVNVLRDSPALAAGLQIGDVLLAVDGTTTIGLTVDEVIQKVRGPRDTTVTLTLERSGEEVEMTITRAVIQTEAVHSRVIEGTDVGYVRIDDFSSKAAEDLVVHLRELVETQRLTRLVLDLRNDPGGFVDQALNVASQFIASGPIYWEETADGRQTPHEAVSGGVATDPAIRVVLLVNGGTASASEIVAGALQDTGRATIVGETTFGKGTVQQWHLLAGDNGGIRLSVAKWLTPQKRWIHGEGIVPEIVVPVPEGTPAGEDPQLDRAVEVLTADTGTRGAVPAFG